MSIFCHEPEDKELYDPGSVSFLAVTEEEEPSALLKVAEKEVWNPLSITADAGWLHLSLETSSPLFLSESEFLGQIPDWSVKVYQIYLFPGVDKNVFDKSFFTLQMI